MKDIKKFLIAALSFMLLVSVSCSNDNKTGSGEETIYNVLGDWYGDDSGSGAGARKMITINPPDGYSGIYYDNSSGSVKEIPINKGDIEKIGNNIYTANITGIGKGTLKFTSDTTGTAKLNTTPEIPINKQ